MLTNLAAMRVSMLVENPQAKVPRPAKNTEAWFAPRRPITLERRPYNGVNVHVASKYLDIPVSKVGYMRLFEGVCLSRRTQFPASLLGGPC